MLKLKLSELNGIENISKSRDPTKTIDTINQIINLMKDLMRLTKKHLIENHLYYGDAINRIYRLMGEARVNRWLSERDDTLFGEPEWLAVIKFLEKDLKICQHKLLIFEKVPEPKKTTEVKKDANRTYHTQEGKGGDEMKPAEELRNCHICNAPDHVPTIGPGYKKIIQYFAYPKWAAMTNAERLKVLKQKSRRYHCLFPGADIHYGKTCNRKMPA